jgi:hypothetical protein
MAVVIMMMMMMTNDDTATLVGGMARSWRRCISDYMSF